MLLLAAMGSVLSVGGCFKVGGDEPLVRFGEGASTTPAEDKTEIRRLQAENRRLKARVVELETELAQARGEAPKRE